MRRSHPRCDRRFRRRELGLALVYIDVDAVVVSRCQHARGALIIRTNPIIFTCTARVRVGWLCHTESDRVQAIQAPTFDDVGVPRSTDRRIDGPSSANPLPNRRSSGFRSVANDRQDQAGRVPHMTQSVNPLATRSLSQRRAAPAHGQQSRRLMAAPTNSHWR